MLCLPATSRIQLEWSKFEKTEDGSWLLVVLDKYYTTLFNQLFPQIMKKSNTGWRKSKKGRTYFCFLKELSTSDESHIIKFIDYFSKYVILGLNKNIVSSFKDELDFVIALNFNANSPDDLQNDKRTDIGQIIYELKNRIYYMREDRINQHYQFIAEELCRVIKFIHYFTPSENMLLSSVPKFNMKGFDLPSEIIKSVHEELSRNTKTENFSLLDAKMLLEKPEFKNLSWIDKIPTWEHVYNNGGINLSCSVEDSDVYIIDDLYQSGATMWSYAKYLKLQGAKRVFGIPCVKTLRDSDNK